MNPVEVLIPVNSLPLAKSRLEGLLSVEERVALQQGMLLAIIEACSEIAASVSILTPDTSIEGILPDGVRCIDEDPAVSGLNAQLAEAIPGLATESVLIVHADLPFANPSDFQRMLAFAPAQPSVTLVPSQDGGTNAMLLQPPEAMRLAYGPGSYARHVALAIRGGFRTATLAGTELSQELDTPEDIRQLLAREDAAQTAAGAYLLQLDLASRLNQ